MKKTVIITGASRGIGACCAKILSNSGYNVVVNFNKSEEAARKVVASITAKGGNAIACRADVSNADDVKKMISKVHNEFGTINFLINNAGIDKWGLLSDLEENDWNRLFDVNVKGIFNACKYIIPEMVNAKSGSIINISSICGISGLSCEVAYSATKGAVIGFTKALAKELGPSNIRVNCIAPGVIQTEMNNRLSSEELDELKYNTPLETIGDPEDIAYAAEFLLSDRAKFITGQVLSPNGGFSI